MHASIIATGSYLPTKFVTNLDLEKKFNTSDKWIREHIGIAERRYVTTETVTDLALKASEQALAAANLKPDDLDAIVFATSTPEYMAPGPGTLLQHRLGCKNIPAFDVRNTSPGFVFALDLADGLIKSLRYKRVLVVASETLSPHLDMTDKGRLMSVIFGDGAGAVILEASDDIGIIDTVLHSNGEHFDKLWCEAKHPEMDGRFVFDSAVQCMTDVVQELLTRNKLGTRNVDHFIFHQANARILDEISNRLKLDATKVPSNIERYGNTSGATIPILLDELWRNKKIVPQQTVVMTSFGSGLSWGSILLKI